MLFSARPRDFYFKTPQNTLEYCWEKISKLTGICEMSEITKTKPNYVNSQNPNVKMWIHKILAWISEFTKS